MGGVSLLRVLAAGFWLVAAPAATAALNEGPSTLVELDAALTALQADSTIPGASVVVIENGEIVYSANFGVVDISTRQPVTDSTIFRAGSISKSFTAIAVMMLVEDGALDLDAQVSSFLRDLDIGNRWESSDPVRLVHLLEHTSGLSDIAFRHYFIEGGGETLEEAVRLYTPYRVRWRPGTRTSYSNAGPVIAGRMIELASGETFTGFVQRRLFAPLGMTDSFWTREPVFAQRIASSYGSDGQTVERFIDPAGRPSGSLNTTALDLAQLPRLMLGRGTLDGVTYFSPETAALIERPSTSDAARAGLGHGHGLGNEADVSGRTVYFGHDGTIDGFMAAARYSLELDAGYVLIANALSPAFEEAEQLIRDYLERGLDPPVATPVELPEAMRQSAGGQYQTMTPRRPLLSPLIGLTQWEGMAVGDSHLTFRGERYIHVGNGQFQAEGHAAPSLVWIDSGGRHELHAGFGAHRRVSSIEMWAKVAAVTLTVLVLLTTLLFAAVWVPSAFLGRLRSRGGVAARFWPTLAVAGSTGAAFAPLIVLQTASFEALARPTTASLAVFALSIAAPVIAIAALWMVTRSERVSTPVRVILVTQCMVAAMVCGYLAWGGWIGLRIWTA